MLSTYLNALKIKSFLDKQYSDQTGRFPYQSSCGHKYLFVMYNFDANAILVALLKNCNATSLVEAWELCHCWLTTNGHAVNLHILDNKISKDFITALIENNITYQLAPPGMHRVNTAELALCDPQYPIKEWNWLIP